MTGKKVFSAIGQTVKHPLKHPVRFVAGVLGVYLVADLVISDKGKSQLAKLGNMVLPKGHHHGPRPPAPAPAPARAAGAFGPGWGRGNMPTMYGPGGQPVGQQYGWTPSDVSIHHRGWAAASGAYPEFYNQSFYPWA